MTGTELNQGLGIEHRLPLKNERVMLASGAVDASGAAAHVDAPHLATTTMRRMDHRNGRRNAGVGRVEAPKAPGPRRVPKGVTASYAAAYESQEMIFADLRSRLDEAKVEGARLRAAIDAEDDWSDDDEAPSWSDLVALLDEYDAQFARKRSGGKFRRRESLKRQVSQRRLSHAPAQSTSEPPDDESWCACAFRPSFLCI